MSSAASGGRMMSATLPRPQSGSSVISTPESTMPASPSSGRSGTCPRPTGAACSRRSSGHSPRLPRGRSALPGAPRPGRHRECGQLLRQPGDRGAGNLCLRRFWRSRFNGHAQDGAGAQQPSHLHLPCPSWPHRHAT
jgi:hypothetical protein